MLVFPRGGSNYCSAELSQKKFCNLWPDIKTTCLWPDLIVYKKDFSLLYVNKMRILDADHYV